MSMRVYAKVTRDKHGTNQDTVETVPLFLSVSSHWRDSNLHTFCYYKEYAPIAKNRIQGLLPYLTWLLAREQNETESIIRARLGPWFNQPAVIKAERSQVEENGVVVSAEEMEDREDMEEMGKQVYVISNLSSFLQDHPPSANLEVEHVAAHVQQDSGSLASQQTTPTKLLTDQYRALASEAGTLAGLDSLADEAHGQGQGAHPGSPTAPTPLASPGQYPTAHGETGAGD
jgi:hypothetical protein